MTTFHEVANWMHSHVQQHGELYQDDAAAQIESRFGKDFIYINDSGNVAIDRSVLKEFRRLSESTVVWERSDRYWRSRQIGDDSQRQQS